jgi:hypothetical protein
MVIAATPTSPKLFGKNGRNWAMFISSNFLSDVLGHFAPKRQS